MTMTTQTKLLVLIALSGLLVAGCSSQFRLSGPNADPSDPNIPSAASQDPSNVFDHPPILDIDPFELLHRLQKAGPPEFQAKLHSCNKMKYDTFGRILASRGININNATATSAGTLYRNGMSALGTANYGQHVAEATDVSTAILSKMFDIWVAAANEMITAMPNAAACKIAGGTEPQFFDAAGSCTKAGIECVTGLPANQTHVDLCNQIVAGASTQAIGRTIAVATIASAAHTCE
jgi:hypothetical protein